MKNSYKQLLVCAIIIIAGHISVHGQITEIITDYNSFWKSGRPVINTVRPDNSHNLLAFKYRNQYYATGVNNTRLTDNGITYNAGDYRALPITTVAAPISGTFIGLGQLYDGVDNGASNPAPVNNVPFYLTDGPKGLNLGTAVYNLPVSNIQFDVSIFSIPKVGDSIPDIIVTQMGETVNTSLDILYLTNANGDTVGNPITVRFLGIDTLGLGVFDFYTANTNPMTIATGNNFTKSARALRFFATDLSAFGLNGTNANTVKYFNIKLSGTSDVAFIAYNAEVIKVRPDNNPGAFSTLPGLWMKANDGTSTVSNNAKTAQWYDRSPNAFSLEQAATSIQPMYKNGTNTGFNFNPYMNFDASNRLIGINSPFTSETSNADFFIVGRPTNTATGRNKIIGFSRSAADNLSTGQGDFPELSYNATGASVIDNGNNPNPLTGTTSSLNSTYLWRTNYTNGNPISFFKNGIADGTGGIAANVGKHSFQIGDATPGDNLSDFDIAELIVFPLNLTTLERNKVETYLGIKYGITLNHDYVNGAGTTTWSISGNSGYNNNIFGIGREESQGLHQKQSKSGTANALVTMGITSIATENITNFNSLTDVTYSVMGDNNGSLSWQTSEKPSKIAYRIGREWKVRETGSVGSLLLQVPASTSTLTEKLPQPNSCKMFLLVDNDGDFSSDIIAQVEMTLNGTNWEASYNFSDGNYYTFATENNDYGDLSATWPQALAGVNGCDVNKDAVYNNADNNGSKVLVWAGQAVTSELTANVMNTDGADDGFIADVPFITPGAVNPFTVMLNSNTANTTVYYRLWFDWNNDGNFANDSSLSIANSTLIPATYTGSGLVSGSGPLSISLNVKPPFTFSLQYKIRLIVSDAPIADMYRSSGPTYQFALANGEVEDYMALITLPITLKNFAGTLQGCNTLLQWKTATELNSSSFHIEQSTNGRDFTTIGKVLSKNENQGAAYRFYVGSLAAGLYYYRLKMMDKDGAFVYSSVVTVNVDCSGNTITLSPNPAKDDLYVSGLSKNAQIVITDQAGRVLQVKKEINTNSLHVNLSGWVPGVYTLQVVENRNPGSTYKFIKVK